MFASGWKSRRSGRREISNWEGMLWESGKEWLALEVLSSLLNLDGGGENEIG